MHIAQFVRKYNAANNKSGPVAKDKINSTVKWVEYAADIAKMTELLKHKVQEADSGGDHEVGMAMGQLEDIMKNATELKGKIGTQEKNLPGWITDHISQAMQFINQANTGYHELGDKEAE